MIRFILSFVLACVCSLATAEENPSVMQIFAKLETQGTPIVLSKGSAVLTDREAGCLTTNHHVAHYEQVSGATLVIAYEGEYRTVTVKTEHAREDLALVCFVTKPNNLPAAIQKASSALDLQSRYIGIGFPIYTANADKTALQQAVWMRLTDRNFVFKDAAKEADKLADALRKYKVASPRVRISEEFIVGTVTDWADFGKIFKGISGGALLDTEGKLVGITSMTHGPQSLLVIPADKIPDTFFK